MNMKHWGHCQLDSKTISGSAELSEGPTLPSSAEEEAANCLSWPYRVAKTGASQSQSKVRWASAAGHGARWHGSVPQPRAHTGLWSVRGHQGRTAAALGAVRSPGVGTGLLGQDVGILSWGI